MVREGGADSRVFGFEAPRANSTGQGRCLYLDRLRLALRTLRPLRTE